MKTYTKNTQKVFFFSFFFFWQNKELVYFALLVVLLMDLSWSFFIWPFRKGFKKKQQRKKYKTHKSWFLRLKISRRLFKKKSFLCVAFVKHGSLYWSEKKQVSYVFFVIELFMHLISATFMWSLRRFWESLIAAESSSDLGRTRSRSVPESAFFQGPLTRTALTVTILSWTPRRTKAKPMISVLCTIPPSTPVSVGGFLYPIAVYREANNTSYSLTYHTVIFILLLLLQKHNQENNHHARLNLKQQIKS